MLFIVNTDKLEDELYIETLTSTEGWSKLESFIRGSLVIEIASHLSREDLEEKTREHVLAAFTQGLEPEEAQRITETLRANDFLNTLIRGLNPKNT